MDLDQNLLRLQGALSSLSVTTPDNEKLQLISSLFQNVDETAKTKMVFFLILNTKMSLTNMLSNDIDFNFVSHETQNLDFSALSYIIFNLELVGNLSDIVCNTPAALTVEFLSGIFAYAVSRVQIRGMQKVITGLFEKILKISKGIDKEFSYFAKLWEFLNSFGDMIWRSSSFDYEDLLEEDMSNILETCLICVNLYQENIPISFNKSYELKILLDKLPADDYDSMQPPDCRTRFLKYINRLLDLFNDIFNSSLRYDSIESLADVSEDALSLYEKLHNSDIEPSNLSYLNEILMPENESDNLAELDIAAIIDSVLNSEDPERYLRTLINFPYFAESEEALICIQNHLNFLESQDLMIIACMIEEQFKKDSFSMLLGDLYLCCLNCMSLGDLFFQFENYFALRNRPNLENSTFDEELTELFNKMLDRDAYTKSRLVLLCIQSPVKTIKKICQHAIYNAEQLNCSVADLKMLKPACLVNYFSPGREPELDIISSVLCDMMDNDYGPGEKARLIGLIQQLQRKDTLNINIENFILNMIHKEYCQGNYDKLEFALEILRGSIKTNLICCNEIVLLAFFSQLLNQTSWSCSSYTPKLARIREILICSIHAILYNTDFLADDTGLAWLRNEIMKTTDINKAHFCELWHSYDCELAVSNDLYIQLFILIHTTSKIDSTIDFIVKSFQRQKLLTLRISFTAAFIQILPIITYRGWTILMTHVKEIITSWQQHQEEESDIDVNLVLFRIFTMSLYSLAQDMNQNQDMMLCFSYCLRNFGRMIQEHFLMDTDLKHEVAIVFVEELLFLLNGIQDSKLRNEISILLSPVIFETVNLVKQNISGEDTKITDLENWYKQNFIGGVGVEELNAE